MKKIFLFLVLIVGFMGCSKSSTTNRNPNVPYVAFSLTLNLNLPSYAGLNSNANPKLIIETNAGVNGLIVMKVSDTDFRAWEANCPNISPSSCSRLTINGINAVCPCDSKEYNLFTGVGNGEYPLIAYRVEILGNNAIRISN
jgi:nitrite reductase/ring-hydroxylating ferredoxin subunit